LASTEGWAAEKLELRAATPPTKPVETEEVEGNTGPHLEKA